MITWFFAELLWHTHGMDAARLAQRLRDCGVETRPFFLGMHEQPVFHRRGLFNNDRHPVAERLANEVISLPMYPDLAPSMQDRIVAAVERACSA